MEIRLSNIHGIMCMIFTLCLTGCGGPADTRPARNSVSGVVKYQRKPVEGAVVVFRPVGIEGKTANGRTDAKGEFSMGTYAGSDGVIAGDYSIMISKMKTTDSAKVYPEDDPNYDPNPKPVPSPQNLLPEKFASAKTSELTISVAEGKEVTNLKYELND
jgi:hypothetical protein